MRRLVFAFFVAVSFGFALPSSANDLAPPPQGAIYIGNGRMLEAAQSHQLSLNQNIYQFAYQPGGLEIAYAGIQTDSSDTTLFIRLVGLKRGSMTTLYSQTFPPNTDGNPAGQEIIYLTRLAGWSGDGRYLLVQQYPVDTDPYGVDYFCIDVGQESIHVSPVALPANQDPTQHLIHWYWWSPDRTRLLFASEIDVHDGDRTYLADTQATIFDPARDHLKPLPLPEKTYTRGWLDSSHLLVVSKADTTVRYFSDDLTAGRLTPIPKPAKMPILSVEGNAPKPAISPQSAFLILEDEAKMTTDEPKTATAPYHALWVRRTKGIKPLSAMPVGLTPGNGDPQARWSPTGNQIAFIAHGDLFITDLSERDATGQEKLAAGETLTCAEEREVASSNLKQIGLGIIQYAQDNDEKYPAEAGVKDTVMPYLKDESLFNVGGHPFVYHAPADLSMANLDAPADTVLGTMNLPCAQVVLYADGHVKTLPKGIDAGTTPGGAGR